MQIFAIVGTKTEQHGEIVRLAKERYTEANVYTIPDVVFLASARETTQEVAIQLGIGDDNNNYTGVVVMVNYYWGYHSKDLWEWIAARSSINVS